MDELIEKARHIRLVIFDVDGVLTDGRLYFGDNGQELKAFHVRDGLGMKQLLDAGIQIAIITGRYSQIVTQRMTSLGVQHVFQGQTDKTIAFQKLCESLALEPIQIAYLGDDINDIPVLEKVGLAMAVADAHENVKTKVHGCTQAKGGHGAAREVCDLILHSQGLLIY